MALVARYLLLAKPPELTSGQWSTIQSYLAGNSGLGRFALTSQQPNERLQRLQNGTGYLYEGLMEEADLTAAGLAALYSAALGGAPDAATIEGYLAEGSGAPMFQPFELAGSWETSRRAVRRHIATYGYVPRGPRTGAGDLYYISPTGSSSNDGSEASPWSLAHVFAGAGGALLPKDKVIALPGTYAIAEDETRIASLSGYEGQPIEFRGRLTDWIAGNYAIISGHVDIPGNDLRFRNLVFTTPAHERFRDPPTDPNFNWLYDNVNKYGQRVEILNCFVHDKTSNGIGDWGPASGGKTYGNLIWCNGLDAGDRGSGPMWIDGVRQPGGSGHGHGIYSQADGSALKYIGANVLSQNWGSGEWESQGTDGAANKWALYAENMILGNLLVGWAETLQDIEVRDHFQITAGTRLGINPSIKTGLQVTRGIFIRAYLEINNWDDGVVDGARFIDRTGAVPAVGGIWTPEMIANTSVDNLLLQSAAAKPFNRNGTAGLTLADTQALGWNEHSTQEAAPTTGHEQWVVPNAEDDAADPDVRLGLVLSLNHDLAAVHTLDLSSFALTAGQAYRLRDAFNPLAQVVEFTADGSDTAVAIDTSAYVLPTPLGTYQGAPVPGPVDTVTPWSIGVGAWALEYAHDPGAAGGSFPSVFSSDFSSDFA